MRKAIFTILLVIPLIHYGQQSHIGVSGGYADNGFALLVNYNHALNKSSYLQFGAYGSFAKNKQPGYEISYSDFTANIGYYINVYQNNLKQFKIALGVGGVGGYELINNGNNELQTGALIDAESKLIYGGFVGAEIDIALNDNISVYGVVNEYYHINSDIGNLTFYGGVGIKYYFF